MIGGDVEEHLDLYFRQCSLLVNTADLAIISGTLANGGRNPITGDHVLSAEHVRSVLSVMNTCGMYDYAGGWQFDVGLPAKSGVGGGIAAVLPGHLGIGVFSPRLDPVGNSERGVKVCEDISRNFRLHLFEDRGAGQDPVRRLYRGTDVRSSRVRRQAEVAALDYNGYAIGVCEVQGEVSFMQAERISRRIGDELSGLTYLILDLTRVRRVDPVAQDILRRIGQMLESSQRRFAVASTDERLRNLGGGDGFPSLDTALEHFEDVLLNRVLQLNDDGTGSMALGDFALLADWPAAHVEELSSRLMPRSFSSGEALISAGTVARSLYFLTSGRVDVSIAVGGGVTRRISTIDAGNVFGELALFGQAKRTADVVAASEGEVLELGVEGIGDLAAKAPAVHVALALAVGRSLADRLGRANREIQALSR